jgi:hypothetical protein
LPHSHRWQESVAVPIHQSLEDQKGPFGLGRGASKSFDDVKAVITRGIILAYPDNSNEFNIYTYVSSRHMGAVIPQQNGPIVYLKRKLSEEQ